MPKQSQYSTPEELLIDIKTKSDSLSISTDDSLMIEGCRCDDLIRDFGSPLYVISEKTIRENYRRIRNAFESRWDSPVNVLYAIKANNNLAVRAILNQEGAGGDCFGEAELYATFLGGADADRLVLNGSNKELAEIVKAVDLGVRVNIDSEDELGFLEDASNKTGKIAATNLRLKLLAPELDELDSDHFALPKGALLTAIRSKKWGFTKERAQDLVAKLLRLKCVRLDGYNTHVGRVSAHPNGHSTIAACFAKLVQELYAETGFWPKILDIGGGLARERDPESRSLVRNPFTVEDYAEAVCNALSQNLKHQKLALPQLWIEPGRYIIGNAGTLITTVGSIKRDAGHVWVHVDASTNNLMRIDSGGNQHHIVTAVGMKRPHELSAMIVGSTCIPSVLGADRQLPNVSRGDVLAVLDAGMYAETTSTQFNGVPRPATVLVSESRVEVIKERETIQDVFHKHRIPERLRALTHQSP